MRLWILVKPICAGLSDNYFCISPRLRMELITFTHFHRVLFSETVLLKHFST